MSFIPFHLCFYLISHSKIDALRALLQNIHETTENTEDLIGIDDEVEEETEEDIEEEDY